MGDTISIIAHGIVITSLFWRLAFTSVGAEEFVASHSLNEMFGLPVPPDGGGGDSGGGAVAGGGVVVVPHGTPGPRQIWFDDGLSPPALNATTLKYTSAVSGT